MATFWTMVEDRAPLVGTSRLCLRPGHFPCMTLGAFFGDSSSVFEIFGSDVLGG